MKRQQTLNGKVLPEPSILSELEQCLPLVEEQGYKKIKIPKTRGKWRELCIPSPDLKKVQRRILRLLRHNTNILLWHKIFGLYKGHSSHIEHAETHSNSRSILTLDVENAFQSITQDKIQPILCDKILRNMVQNISPDLTEKYPPKDVWNFWEDNYPPKPRHIQSIWANRLCQIILKLTIYEKKLPQGAPTSPFLFYMFLSEKMEHIDSAISRELRKIKVSEYSVSIYVDNIVISTKRRRITPEAISEIINSIESVGLPINRQKTRLYDCRQGAAIITGLSVDGKGNVAISKTKRETIRAILNNACYVPYNPKLDAKIEGTISYVKQVYGDKIPNRIKEPYDKYREHRNLQKLALISLEPITN